MRFLFGLVFIIITWYEGVSQIQRNPLLEIVTGTWCQDCPCGEEMANFINQNYSDAVVLAHHYWDGGDPFGSAELDSFTIAMNYVWLPSAFIDRAFSPPAFSYGKWDSVIVARLEIETTVDLSMSGILNPNSRVIDFTINSWTINDLLGKFKLVVLITEDSLVANQTGSTECPGGSNFIHNFIVRDFISSHLGDSIQDNDSVWSTGDTISVLYKYTIPSNYNLDKVRIVAYIFKENVNLNTSNIYQAKKWNLFESLILDVNDNSYYPVSYILGQNYPNPFNPSTKISWQSPVDGWQTLKVYDVLGNEVATLVDEYKPAGKYEIEFNSASNIKNLASGIYFYRLQTGSFVETKKMILTK
jgi:hypothetical protein